MSRGLGAIQRKMSELFPPDKPETCFSTVELCKLLYGASEKKHRVAVLRAARAHPDLWMTPDTYWAVILQYVFYRKTWQGMQAADLYLNRVDLGQEYYKLEYESLAISDADERQMIFRALDSIWLDCMERGEAWKIGEDRPELTDRIARTLVDPALQVEGMERVRQYHEGRAALYHALGGR